MIRSRVSFTLYQDLYKYFRTNKRQSKIIYVENDFNDSRRVHQPGYFERVTSYRLRRVGFWKEEKKNRPDARPFKNVHWLVF